MSIILTSAPSPEKMTTQQLNSQFSNIKKEIVRIDTEIAGKSKKETFLKRIERGELSDNLGKSIERDA